MATLLSVGRRVRQS